MRIRQFDWSRHPLGPPESWPQNLATALSICLSSRFPIVLYWGPEFRAFYNDAYIPILGDKHPSVLARTGLEAWGEIWDVIGPMLQQVLDKGQATWSDDQLLLVRRFGYLEEAYFTWSFSPIYNTTGSVDGVFTAVFETTGRVLGERRLRTLRELGTNATLTRTIDDACARFVQTLDQNPSDVPFALIYLFDEHQHQVSLKCSLRLAIGHPACAQHLASDESPGRGWPITEALVSGEPAVVDLPRQFSGSDFPGGKWPESAKSAVVVPIPGAEASRPFGVLVLGVNPRRAFDDDYEGFFQLVAGQFSSALSNAQSYENERRRAEALAELDRAKTAFFNNVSHEFRTPLTLMLGPLEEFLNAGASPLPAPMRSQIEMIHRNGLRLLKLVNTLLDFSRMEAGRIEANYEPLDLATLTADLASAFRSTLEKAGLRFTVDCAPLPDPVFADRDMWEKIVFNLLSNAFKFTFQGGVTLRLARENADAVLRVADTGTGIPESELPNLFKRFHRVQNARSRTYEGTGIGLALVQELVKLHGGSVSAESTVGQGTVFTVRVPFGKGHLPADRISAPRRQASTALSGEVFVEEASHWEARETQCIPPAVAQFPESAPPNIERLSRVLIVDDNADMRDYICRLLQGRYELITAADGAHALAIAHEKKPDLVLSDIMMAGLDGVALLQAIRNDGRLKATPVILLSARAGGEARVEGIERGADDYLVKPFSARELLARIETHLRLARVRAEMNRELEEQVEERTASLRQAVEQMEEFSYSVSHDLRAPVRAMQSYAEAILEDHAGNLDEEGRYFLNRIAQGASRMDQLIRDVLTYSRVSRREMQLQPVALDRLVRDVIEQYPEFAANRAKITIRGQLPSVIAHEPSLSQVISNLLSNAVKFVKRGDFPEVLVRSEFTDGQVRVWIEDNGVGIRPEYQPRLFGMFERVHPDGGYEGTGIGLAIVRKAVERMGGKAGVESDGVHGSRFWIQLPPG